MHRARRLPLDRARVEPVLEPVQFVSMIYRRKGIQFFCHLISTPLCYCEARSQPELSEYHCHGSERGGRGRRRGLAGVIGFLAAEGQQQQQQQTAAGVVAAECRSPCRAPVVVVPLLLLVLLRGRRRCWCWWSPTGGTCGREISLLLLVGRGD